MTQRLDARWGGKFLPKSSVLSTQFLEWMLDPLREADPDTADVLSGVLSAYRERPEDVSNRAALTDALAIAEDALNELAPLGFSFGESPLGVYGFWPERIIDLEYLEEYTE